MALWHLLDEMFTHETDYVPMKDLREEDGKSKRETERLKERYIESDRQTERYMDRKIERQ